MDTIKSKKDKMHKIINCNKLWKLLIDRNMTKSDLRDASGISTVSLAKLGKNENITTTALLKICTALNCDVSDIMEMVDVRSDFERTKHRLSKRRTEGEALIRR